MKLENTTILLTGASGGIGSALARQLAQRGARLQLSGRDAGRLQPLAQELRASGAAVVELVGDLGSAAGVARIAHAAISSGTPEVVIHCAGQMAFGGLEGTSATAIEQLWHTNVIAPSLLTRALLPAMRRRGGGRLVFVGSIFGSLGFPLYSTYSASKFALRGFSEALRRELSGTGVDVTYVAPRYTRTAFNSGAPERLARAMKMSQDEPDKVASGIVRAIERDRREVYFGFAERFFVRLNSWFPSLLDRALGGQARRMRELEPAAVRGDLR